MLVTGLECPECGCRSVTCRWWDSPVYAPDVYYDNFRHQCWNEHCRHAVESLNRYTTVDDAQCPFCGRDAATEGEMIPLRSVLRLNPAWLTCNHGRVGEIAQDLQNDGRFGNLPLLASALEGV